LIQKKKNHWVGIRGGASCGRDRENSVIVKKRAKKEQPKEGSYEKTRALEKK